MDLFYDFLMYALNVTCLLLSIQAFYRLVIHSLGWSGVLIRACGNQVMDKGKLAGRGDLANVKDV